VLPVPLQADQFQRFSFPADPHAVLPGSLHSLLTPLSQRNDTVVARDLLRSGHLVEQAQPRRLDGVSWEKTKLLSSSWGEPPKMNKSK